MVTVHYPIRALYSMAKLIAVIASLLYHILAITFVDGLNAGRPLPTATVLCGTTKGDIKIDVYREWAPLGADRFLELVRDDYYTDIGLFRCVKRFLTQFGISDNPTKKHWSRKEIKDDPNLHLGIKKNYVSFAGGGAGTRSTQIFIAFEDLDFLGKEPWETPFGMVIEGQSTLDALYKGYGDIPPFGKGPDQQKIHNRGNAYLRENFPLLDFLTSCHVIGEDKDKEKEEEKVHKVSSTASSTAPARHEENHPRKQAAKRVEEVDSSSSKTKAPQPVPVVKQKQEASMPVSVATAAGNLRRVVGEVLSTRPPSGSRDVVLPPAAVVPIVNQVAAHGLEAKSVDKSINKKDRIYLRRSSNRVQQQQSERTNNNNSNSEGKATGGDTPLADTEGGGGGRGNEIHAKDVINFIPPNRVLPRRNLVPDTEGGSSGFHSKGEHSTGRTVFAAVGFLSFALGVMYCMQRQQAAIAATSKKS